MNAKKENLFGKIVAVVLGALVLIGPFAKFSVNAAEAQQQQEIIYYENVYAGQGTQISASYTIDCDEMVVEAHIAHSSVPSYGNSNAALTNTCGPVAGTNIAVYYDRFCPNLIPDFEPGLLLSSGGYRYYPNIGWSQTNALIENLYSLMQVPTIGGTTSENFKSGLNSYVASKGYTFSYSSFYNNATSVNLSQLITAINAGKVGLVMCSTYNFVYSIDMIENEGQVEVSKINSNTAHMMMVYGYKTISYYTSGVKTRTDTFLEVCSGYGTNDIGYMQLNDFSMINEAIIINIS